MSIVLITGGSGLIGRKLTQALLTQGHEVRWLSRSAGTRGGVCAFAWDVKQGRIDPEALRGVGRIVHLAGAGIADKRWTKARIAELIASRADSARLLLRTAREHGCAPECIVSASGSGYYGAVTRDEPFTESDAPGADTIAHITVEWERAVDEWSTFCRVVKLRTPVVLAGEGGALPKLALPARWGLAAPMGSGRQWMPWIHIDDLVRAYLHALDEKHMHGAYNVLGGNATNADFMRSVARAVGKPLWLPPVPGFLLKAALGEMAGLLLEGSPMNAAHAREVGMASRFLVLDEALRELV
jgi:uncharacterized protein